MSQSQKTVLGIDPGVTGAFALVRPGELVTLADLPTRSLGRGFVRREIDPEALADVLRPFSVSFAALERTSALHNMGAASAFSFGVSRGALLGVLAGLRIRIVQVLPEKWKAHHRLIGAPKSGSLQLARNLYPEAARTTLARASDHNRAEALLIARYALDNIPTSVR